ncbi:hypothetical protein [Mesorhizobium sp.]|uniref:hypothetical protein n=1 Tax=Mesorhizobium sp. TaxID=1871066 RepID=UPI0025DB8957|nr:hypothetical protein [Mesorhizobium sp.]
MLRLLHGYRGLERAGITEGAVFRGIDRRQCLPWRDGAALRRRRRSRPRRENRGVEGQHGIERVEGRDDFSILGLGKLPCHWLAPDTGWRPTLMESP